MQTLPGHVLAFLIDEILMTSNMIYEIGNKIGGFAMIHYYILILQKNAIFTRKLNPLFI